MVVAKSHGILFLYLTFVALTSSQTAPSYPSFEDIYFGTEAEITAIQDETNSRHTNVFREYHDVKGQRGRLDSVESRQIIFYYQKLNQMVVVSSDKRCYGFKMNETDVMDSLDSQWGWWDKDDKLIGPAAILKRYKPTYEKNEYVRRILCNKFVATDGNISLAFYMADQTWLDANGIKNPFPVRVTFNGTRKLRGQDQRTMGQVDFIAFQLIKPFEFENIVKIPHGIGCQSNSTHKGIVTHPGKVFPKLPNDISYIMETFNIETDTANRADTFVNLAKVWFHAASHYVRVDGYDSDFVRYSEVQDYNTGVNYRVYPNDTCFLSPIQNQAAESHEKGFMGKMKNANELLNMDADYYFLGMEIYRSIYCEVWEAIIPNKTAGGTFYSNVIATYYISASAVVELSEVDPNVRVPVALIISAFKADVGGEPDVRALYNFFNFDETKPHQFLREVDLSKCFEEESQKNYFMVRFQGISDAQIKQVTDHKASFEVEALLGLAVAAQASLVRFPVLQVHVENKEIVLFGLILSRPPALGGFILYNEQGFTPTVDMDQVANVDNPEQCADFCLRHNDYTCRIFSLCNHPSTCKDMQNCKYQCFLGKQDIDTKFGETLPGSFNCQLFARAVAEEGIVELDLVESLKALNQSISEKRFKINLSEDNMSFDYTATVLQTGLKPFNDFNHGLLYETSFSGFQLKNSAGSFATQEVYEKIGTPELCYDRCVKDSRLSCASFSYCPNTGLCRLSSLYLTVDATDSIKHIEPATACRVYRKRDFDFFEKTPGKVAVVAGKKVFENVVDTESCAVWCKSDKEVICKSYDYCSNTKNCVLHDVHHFDEGLMKPDQNDFCNHYHLKYSTEYTLSPGFQIVDDKQATVIRAISFEDCAKSCSDSEKCRSINFCPGSVEEPNVCALNTMAIYDANATTMVSDICQHYSSRMIQADTNPLFVNIRDLVTNGYQATIEVTTKNYNFNKETKSYVVNEYHDLKRKRGRVDRMNIGSESRASWFYFTETMQVANISGSSCKVDSFEDPKFYDETMFWRDIAVDDFIAGPSGVLYRETVSEPQFTSSNTYVRGVPCNQFLAVDKNDTNVNIAYHVPKSWKTSDDKPFPYPIRVEAYGRDNNDQAVNVQVDITTFIPSIREFDEFQVPVGIGCVGLKTTGGRQFPPVEDQFSFTAEVYNIFKTSEKVKSHVLLYKMWFDAMNKVLMMVGVDEKFQPFKSVADFNTGVQYMENQYNSCEIQGIKNSPGQGPNGEVRAMKNGSTFLGFDGDYYYIGKGLVRSVYCDIWETVKNDVYFNGSIYQRVVQTVYLQSPEIMGVADDDFNIQVPVKVELRLQSKDSASMSLIENNIFNFDEAEGRLFFNDINIERCFPREEDKANFMVYFPAQDTTVDQRKSNRRRIEVDARLSIAQAAEVSLLRISSLMVNFDQNNVVVLGTLLGKPPPLAGFYLFSDKEQSLSGEIEVKTGIKEPGDCATACVSVETCKGFTYCPGGSGTPIKCFLTSLDIGDNPSDWGESKPGEKRDCSLYFRSALGTKMSEPDLKQAISNLDSNVKKGTVKLGIAITGKGPVTLVANKTEERLNPFNWEDKDLFDTVFTQRRLDVGSETVLDKEMALSASECNQLCLEEESMFCSSFSYCKHDGNCRLSSQYIDPESSTSQEDVEKGTATACNVYRRGSIKFFDKKQGLIPKNTGDKFVSTTLSADQCAFLCRQEKTFPCKGFEYCDNSNGCVLYKTHSLDVPLTPGNPICSHYSLKYGLEFSDMGKFELVGPNKPIKTTVDSFEQCSRMCYDLGSDCLSFNYCPGDSILTASCSLLAADSDTPGYELNASEKCSHYFRRTKAQVKRPKVIIINDNRVSGGHFAAVTIGVLIFGMFLGAAGFILLSLYKSRHQNADGTAVRYVKGP